MEILIFFLGIGFILVSLFLTYRQEQVDDDTLTDYIQINKKLRKREQELNKILKKINYNFYNILDELEAKQKELEKLTHKESENKIKEEDFTNTLDSELAEVTNRKDPAAKLKQLKEVEQETSQKLAGSSNPGSDSEKYQQIVELFSDGLDFEEIAQELNLGQREVELIWKLNNRGEV